MRRKKARTRKKRNRAHHYLGYVGTLAQA